MSIVDDWLAETLRHVNDSLPKRTEPLAILLAADEPSVETIGGGRHFFDKNELEAMFRSLPEDVASGLRLPLVFTKRHELGEPVYVIRGSGKEAEAFRILVGLQDLPKMGNEAYTYKPLVMEFLSKYPTLGVIGFI